MEIIKSKAELWKIKFNYVRNKEREAEDVGVGFRPYIVNTISNPLEKFSYSANNSLIICGLIPSNYILTLLLCHCGNNRNCQMGEPSHIILLYSALPTNVLFFLFLLCILPTLFRSEFASNYFPFTIFNRNKAIGMFCYPIQFFFLTHVRPL